MVRDFLFDRTFHDLHLQMFAFVIKAKLEKQEGKDRCFIQDRFRLDWDKTWKMATSQGDLFCFQVNYVTSQKRKLNDACVTELSINNVLCKSDRFFFPPCLLNKN